MSFAFRCSCSSIMSWKFLFYFFARNHRKERNKRLVLVKSKRGEMKVKIQRKNIFHQT